MNVKVVLEFLTGIRGRYPGNIQVHIVMDGLSAHGTKVIRDWAVAHGVSLLPTPTGAQSPQPHRMPLLGVVGFVINGSEYPGWTEFSKATQAYIRRRGRDHHDPGMWGVGGLPARSSGLSQAAGQLFGDLVEAVPSVMGDE